MSDFITNGINITDFYDENKQNNLITTYGVLIDKIKYENEMIYNSYLSGINNKSENINKTSDILDNIFYYLVTIYYILAIGVCSFLLFDSYSISIKIILILLIIFFPYYIFVIQRVSFYIYNYIYTILLSQVYMNGYYNSE